MVGSLVLTLAGCDSTPSSTPGNPTGDGKPEIIQGAAAGPEMDHLLTPAAKAAAEKKRSMSQKSNQPAKP